MKKKLNNLPKLNKKARIRFFIFLAIIIILEAVTGIVVFMQFSSRTYKQEYSAFNDRATALHNVLSEKYTDDDYNKILNNPAILNSIVTDCKSNGGFDDYIVFFEVRGDIVYGGEIFSFPNTTNLDALKIPYSSLNVHELEGKDYILVPINLGMGYHVLCVTDFSATQANIDNVLGNLVAILIASGLLITFSFLIYAYFCVGKERTSLFNYKLSISPTTGRILDSNRTFKRDFSNAVMIPTPEKLDRKNFSLVSLSDSNGNNSLVVLTARTQSGKLKAYGGALSNAESFIQMQDSEALDADGMSTGSLCKLFESFTAKGKRTLLGVMLISNLDQIKTLFGKQMALDIQKIILKKVKEKFNYAYELDFAYIGVTYPDGKKFDNLMADMEDVFRYINAPIKMDDNLFTLDIKAGFALCDSSMVPLTFEHAFKAAEAAKQRAIDTKIAEYIIYHESQKKLYAKYFITYDIKQMLSEGAFEMEYQPQYNIKEERVEGFEALFRVKKSWNVNVDTFSFITYAERTGAMVQLGDFIFDTGMQFAKRLEGKNISVSLNVSPVQLMQAGFIENFLRLYRKYDLKEGSICVEITESFLMTNFAETMKKLTVLTQQGILVHLDDFGTEYSSLLYIKKLPISTIKIDKEFVKDVLVSRESQSIIKFITNIAKLLNGTTICEGVETCQEFDMLKYLGCDTIQGWVISKSLKPDDALKFIETFDYKQVVLAQQAKEKQS
ncbi:MAG: EAL domain-containing protein [Candidatus Coproplasma sp.]